MLRILSIVAAFILVPQISAADAVWANYSFNVKPGAEAKLEKAVRDYFEGNNRWVSFSHFNTLSQNPELCICKTTF